MRKKCNTCNKISRNEYICDHCGRPMNYEASSKSENMGQTYKREFPKISIPKISFKNLSFNKNNIIIGSILIIALSFAMNAYTKYREQKQMEELVNDQKEAMKALYGITLGSQKSIKKSFEQLNQHFHK